MIFLTFSLPKSILNVVGFGSIGKPLLTHRHFGAAGVKLLQTRSQIFSAHFSTLNGHEFKPLTVVLDLDECLIHTELPQIAGTVDPRQKENRPTVVHGAGEHFNVNIMGDKLKVYKRPGVQDFIKSLGDDKDIEVMVFTASEQCYADPIIDKLDPSRNAITQRFYRQHCDLRHGAYVKDLKRITSNFKRIVLVDNNPISFLAQPLNGVPVKSFFGEASDRELESVLNFLTVLKQYPDVQLPLQSVFELDKKLSIWREKIYGIKKA